MSIVCRVLSKTIVLTYTWPYIYIVHKKIYQWTWKRCSMKRGRGYHRLRTTKCILEASIVNLTLPLAAANGFHANDITVYVYGRWQRTLPPPSKLNTKGSPVVGMCSRGTHLVHGNYSTIIALHIWITIRGVREARLASLRQLIQRL